MSRTVGFVGVGAMGGPLARRLLSAGFRILVHDRDAAAAAALGALGAEVADTLDALAPAEIVCACLPTPYAVREVAGALPAPAPGASRIWIDCSTTGPAIAREVAAGLAARGIAALDAPVSQGQGRSLSLYVAGAPEVVAAARPVLDVLGDRVFVVGAEPGLGQMLKVVNNLLNFVAFAATCEAAVLGVKAGLDPVQMMAAISHGSGRNSSTDGKFPSAVLTRRFDWGAPTTIAAKDIALCLAEADRLSLPMPLGAATEQLYRIWMADHAEEDFTTLIRMMEGWGGVEVRAP